MPYHLQEADGGWYVVDNTGKRYSKKAMPKKRAAAQMRALYANEKEVKPSTLYSGFANWIKELFKK